MKMTGIIFVQSLFKTSTFYAEHDSIKIHGMLPAFRKSHDSEYNHKNRMVCM